MLYHMLGLTSVYSQVCSTYSLVDMKYANARLVHIGTYGPGTSGKVRCLVGPKPFREGVYVTSRLALQWIASSSLEC